MRRLVFLILALFSFCIHPSANSLVHSQENTKEKAAAGEDFISNKYDQENDTAITIQSKFSRGGGNGGQAATSGGENGGSHSPYVQGGGGVTPVYAAGAGNNRHPHRGGGNRDESRTGAATLVMTTLVCFLLCFN